MRAPRASPTTRARGSSRQRGDGLQNDKKIFDDAGVSDHFAIIPTGTLPEEPLTGDDKRLFDLVVRRFLGAFHPPASWERVERVTEAAGHNFRTRARVAESSPAGARCCRRRRRRGERRHRSPRPPRARVSDRVQGVAVAAARRAIEEETKPPPRISEARLLSLMENAGKQIDDEDARGRLHEKGIGTPATRAEIIENLIRKGYVGAAGQVAAPDGQGHPPDRQPAPHRHRPASPRPS